MIRTFGKTKIVCTLGPATASFDTLIRMINAGMDIARLNLSHGTHDDHRAMVERLREAADRTGSHIAILLDLQGPKIRIGEVRNGPVQLSQGEVLRITTDPVPGDARRVSTTYDHLVSDVKPGDTILLDDGKLRLQVKTIEGNDVVCAIEVGGMLSSHKGINLPGVAVSAPSFTGKDLSDLDLGIALDVDYVALSFVRSADDVRQLRQAVVGRIPKGRFLPIIAKIEKPQAIDNINDIVAEADGVMVARGDLGVELPPEDVPILQKMIIRKCNEAGKPVVIATQMLESMIQSPTPTRAETNDVANAVIDGGDAVMLSGETSVGSYPVEAVELMNRIIRRVEAEELMPNRVLDRPPGPAENRLDAIGRAACVLAEQMNAAAIVVVTHTGNTAKVVSRHRPRPRIFAIADRAKIIRRLNLFRGVQGLLIEKIAEDSDRAVQQIQDLLVETGAARRGEYIVLLAGQPFFARGSTNFIKVEKVE
jgi:pyruvate kinase